ncbi:MAG: hypothetical protein Q4C38_00615 [bacterium]|nr:hypothetical protein [bacterium]
MKKRIMFSVILMLMPLFVDAQAVNISCPKEISLNETFVCTITGTSDKLITSISADLQYGDKLIFQSFTSDWNGACIDNKIGLYTALDKIGTFNIGVVKFKNNGIGNNSVTLNNIKFYDEEDKGISLEPVTKIINIKSLPASSSSSGGSSKPSSSSSIPKEEGITGSSNLLDIEITNYNIDFDKGIYEYDLKIQDEDSLEVLPLLEDNTSEYTITGNSGLKDGSVIKINVISVDKKTSVYKINIHKDNKQNHTMIFIAIIGGLLLINVLRIILKKRKK